MNTHQYIEQEQLRHLTRRHFLKDCSIGLSSLYLAQQGFAAGVGKYKIQHDIANPLGTLAPAIAPKVKRVIHLHMAGAPSQLELFDYKPLLAKYNGKDCPREYLEGQRFAFIQGVPRMLGPQFPFKQHGQSGFLTACPDCSRMLIKFASSKRCRPISSITVLRNYCYTLAIRILVTLRSVRGSLGDWDRKIKTCLVLWC